MQDMWLIESRHFVLELNWTLFMALLGMKKNGWLNSDIKVEVWVKEKVSARKIGLENFHTFIQKLLNNLNKKISTNGIYISL